VKIYLHSDHPLRRICNNFTASYWMILLDLEGKRKTNLENVGSVDVRSQVLVPVSIAHRPVAHVGGCMGHIL